MGDPAEALEERLHRLRKEFGERLRARIAEIESAWDGSQGSAWSEQLLHALERDDLAGPGLTCLESRASLAEMRRRALDLSRSSLALGFPWIADAARALADSVAEALKAEGAPTAAAEAEIAGLMRVLRRASAEVGDI